MTRRSSINHHYFIVCFFTSNVQTVFGTDGSGLSGRTPQHAGMDRTGAGYGGRIDAGFETLEIFFQ